MVSGMYLGEITRNILLHLIDASLLFGGHSSKVLNTHYGFDTSFVSNVEGAKDDSVVRKAVVKDLGVDEQYVTDDDLALVRWACKIVAHRAAYLAATAIAAIYLHTAEHRKASGQELVDCGIDGR
jgi:hexokinase